MARNKYGAKKTEIDGIIFASKKEAKRYVELKNMLEAGDITELTWQMKFPLLPSQKRVGMRAEMPVNYIADFHYYTREGVEIVEDVKGYRTKEYILKRKMLLYFYGIQITEI